MKAQITLESLYRPTHVANERIIIDKTEKGISGLCHH
jgi:hypothetical protein